MLVTNDTNRCFLFAGLDETNRFPRFANDKKFISAGAGAGAAPAPRLYLPPGETALLPGGTGGRGGAQPRPPRPPPAPSAPPAPALAPRTLSATEKKKSSSNTMFVN